MKIYDIAFQRLEDLNEFQKHRLETSRFSGGTLIVPAESPALEVASIADQTRCSQIIVTGDNGEIKGLVVPEIVRTRISQHRNYPPNLTFRQVLEEFADDPEERQRNYHHEWLNDVRVDDVWCEKGRHYIDRDPCNIHT